MTDLVRWATRGRKPRGYSTVVWLLWRQGLLHRAAFQRPSADCHPPALNWFGRLLWQLDYRLDYDGLRAEAELFRGGL